MVSVGEKGYDPVGGQCVFCPNCGTQNESAATPCKKCGFKLSGISVPKFKGTMVMNSEQTVAEMIEEHRKRQGQGQGGPADKNKARASEPAPRRNPGSSAPPSSLGGPRGPVLQPPRVSAPTRGRMGGTMLGVAPQIGGHTPPGGGARAESLGASAQPDGSATPPSATPPSAAPPSAPPSSEPSRSETASAGEAAVATPRLLEEDRAEAPVRGVEASPEPGPSPAPPAAAPAPAATLPLPAATSADTPASAAAAHESDGDELEPAPARAVPVTAPLPQVPEAAGDTPAALAEKAPLAADPKRPSPPRLSPLDIVLIICTFGVYGLVLWARQRKPAA